MAPFGSGNVVVLLLCMTNVWADVSYTIGGCECFGLCERTIDSPFVAWCSTTPPIAEQPAANLTCPTAAYSRLRGAYWEPCVQNITGYLPGERIYLTTFRSMWSYMLVSAVATSTIAYCLMGCSASILTSPKRTLLWLPAVSGLMGAGQGFLIGAPAAACLSFIYLTMPYAIERWVAVALGVGLAILASYTALGRTHGRKNRVHASEMG